MSPAVTPVPPTTGEETRQKCLSCEGALADSALKCDTCTEYVHLRCSGLPDYQLIRLAVSQCSYNCSDCVKAKDLRGDEEKHKLEATKIKELKEKEIAIVQTESNVNNQPIIDPANTELNNSSSLVVMLTQVVRMTLGMMNS